MSEIEVPVAICGRHGVPTSKCAKKKHEHGDRGSDDRFWLQQYNCWGYHGSIDALITASDAHFDKMILPHMQHMSQKSIDWIASQWTSRHQIDADAAAWLLAWHKEESK